ncbi:MAG: hypothetical protein IPH48_08080 [bacterium]|jgi:hypothetical protein|nr:hypothetical protein [bacterium]
MTTRKLRRGERVGRFALLGLIFFAPRFATAQCGMTDNSGHGHDSGHATMPMSDTDSRQAVEKLLVDEHSRDVLANSLLDDADFMHGFIARVLADPEWSSVVARMQTTPPVGSGAIEPAVASDRPASYTCPMHAEVISSTPGICPACGMRLVRAGNHGNK